MESVNNNASADWSHNKKLPAVSPKNFTSNPVPSTPTVVAPSICTAPSISTASKLAVPSTSASPVTVRLSAIVVSDVVWPIVNAIPEVSVAIFNAPTAFVI